ncbi:MAG: carboxypeptidase regulatory-like domain-containing protein [Deltaproteobacteria bacterium]|nr:carboxypeptidase regulatory-like domain-containing protein [Deltaproteobacteria bacterium]
MCDPLVPGREGAGDIGRSGPRARWGLWLCASLLAAGCWGEPGELGLDEAGLRLSGAPQRAYPGLAETESYILLQVPERGRRDVLGRVLSIDRVDGARVWAYASPAELKRLESKGIPYVRLAHPGINPGARMGLYGRGGRLLWDRYPTYAEYGQFLQQLADDYPDLCRLVDLGQSTNQSRPHTIWALKITDNPDADEDEPEVFYTATMHGDETVGYVLMLRLADELLAGYGTDAELTALVDELEIWINPLANPDGTYFSSDSTVNGAIRSFTTSTGRDAWVDPNRNFPDPLYGDHPDGESWWTETQHMMAFAAEHGFALSANFHGGSEVVNYPWDHKPGAHPDEDWFIQLSRAYADRCHVDGPAGYMRELDDGITNGYDWYMIDGGRQDYTTYFHRGREVTIELSMTKNPAASTLETYWTANRKALIDYLGWALGGVRGLVTDPQGAALHATVTVVGHDASAERSEVQSDPAVGDYHRLLLPGSYDLRFAADGYVSQEVGGVVVGSGPATRLDVVLQPASRLDLRGQVTDDRGLPVPAVAVELVGSARPALATSRSGTFVLRDIPADLYTFRLSRAGFETAELARSVGPESSRQDFVLRRVHAFYETDLESDDGGLGASGSPSPGWQWGAVNGAHSGSRAWATALAGDYPDDALWRLTLGPIVLPSVIPELVFWQRYEIESGWDGGNLSIAVDEEPFCLLEPEQGYPHDAIDALGGPGYSGTSDGWVQARFDLSAYAGKRVRLRWTFASDVSETGPGWFVDDIQLTGRKRP